jgi:hypothetical protein
MVNVNTSLQTNFRPDQYQIFFQKNLKANSLKNTHRIDL